MTCTIFDDVSKMKPTLGVVLVLLAMSTNQRVSTAYREQGVGEDEAMLKNSTELQISVIAESEFFFCLTRLLPRHRLLGFKWPVAGR
jgi:hypothetical protein